jgi:hypothetical protein
MLPNKQYARMKDDEYIWFLFPNRRVELCLVVFVYEKVHPLHEVIHPAEVSN